MIPTPEPQERGFATSSDGARIAWYRYGTADRTILFIPTWNLVDARVVGYQVAALEEDATVVTYDPRGAGRSDRPDHGYDFPMHAADAIAVLDAAGAGPVSVVTASRGIGASALLATAHPERVDRLVAVAPYLQFEPPADDRFWTIEEIGEVRDLFSAHGWRADWPAFARVFMERVFSEPGSEETIRQMVSIALDASPEVLITQERDLDWPRIPPLLPAVKAFTLFIRGDEDLAVPEALSDRIVGAVPNSRMHVVPGGGHRPDIRSPELVNPIIREFLLTDQIGGRR